MKKIFGLFLAIFFLFIYMVAILLLGWIVYPERQALYYIFGQKWHLIQIIIFAGVSFFVSSTFVYYYQLSRQKIQLSRQKARLSRLKEILAAGIEVDYEQLLQNIPPFLMQMYRHDFSAEIDYMAVYFYDKEDSRYKLFSFKTKKAQASLELYFLKTDPIPAWFIKDAPLLIKDNILDSQYIEAVRYSDINNPKLFKKNQRLKDALSCLGNSLKSVNADLCVPCFYQDRLLALFMFGKKYKSPYSQEEIDTFVLLARDMAVAIRSAELRNELEQSYVDAIQAIIAALEEKDSCTKGHSERVVKYSMQIAEELKNVFPFTNVINLSEKVRRAALLHDVGKIGIPDSILRKPGKLEKEEFEKIKKHPQISISILQSIRSIPDDVKEGIESHHERYDGTGYCKGEKGRRIPPIARIIAVADSYDAMTSNRSYRKPMTPREATKEILRCTYYKGPQWDPAVVEAHFNALKKDPTSSITQEMLESVSAELAKEEKKPINTSVCE